MKNTVVSLMDEMKSSGTFLGPMMSLTFKSTMDFTPHAENYLGELPMLFAFSEDFKKFNGMSEIKDGYFTLLPLLLKNPSTVILPDFAALFMKEYYTSQIIYREDHRYQDVCYVHMDYYQELSGPEHLIQGFNTINELARNYEHVNLCFSLHALSSRKPNLSHEFYQHVRLLPANCEIISNNELFDCSDFKGRCVYLLTDKDFVMKSPWENIFAARGAIINGRTSEGHLEIVKRIPLSDKAEKVVIKKTSTSLVSQDLREHIEKLAQMIQSDQDYLNQSYLRQLRETIKVIKSRYHVA